MKRPPPENLDSFVGRAATVVTKADIAPKQGGAKPGSKANPAAEGMLRTTLDLPESFHQRLKIAAVRQKRPMRDLVEEAVRSYLESKSL